MVGPSGIGWVSGWWLAGGGRGGGASMLTGASPDKEGGDETRCR